MIFLSELAKAVAFSSPNALRATAAMPRRLRREGVLASDTMGNSGLASQGRGWGERRRLSADRARRTSLCRLAAKAGGGERSAKDRDHR